MHNSTTNHSDTKTNSNFGTQSENRHDCGLQIGLERPHHFHRDHYIFVRLPPDLRLRTSYSHEYGNRTDLRPRLPPFTEPQWDPYSHGQYYSFDLRISFTFYPIFQMCRILSILIHFFFTATFMFMFLESLHTYTIVAFVVKKNGILSRLQNVLIGWGFSLATVLICVGLRYKKKEIIRIASIKINFLEDDKRVQFFWLCFCKGARKVCKSFPHQLFDLLLEIIKLLLFQVDIIEG